MTTSPRAIAAAAPWLADGDVVVVTSKVVSKVEGRLVHVAAGHRPGGRPRCRPSTTEAVRVVARRGPLTIVQTRQGWVLAAAGIDASNVGRGLPGAPARGRRRLGPRHCGTGSPELLGVDVAVVVVSDTFGRTWREGLTDVAVGSAGIVALIDHRGARRCARQPARASPGWRWSTSSRRPPTW